MQTRLYKLLLGLLFACAALIEPALAQDAANYQSGHQPLELWDNDARKSMPQWVAIWLAFMMSLMRTALQSQRIESVNSHASM